MPAKGWRKGMPVKKSLHICKRCGSQFLAYPSSKRKHCSLFCYCGKREKPVVVTCDGCGIPYKTHKSRLLWEHHYCSYKCYLKTVIPPLTTPSFSGTRQAYYRQLIAKYKGICVLCGSNENWRPIVHHLLPHTEGGTDEEENLCCLHRACHRAIERIAKYDWGFYWDVIVPLLRERKDKFIEEAKKV